MLISATNNYIGMSYNLTKKKNNKAISRIKILTCSSGKHHYTTNTRCENNNGALSCSTYAHKSIIKIHLYGGTGLTTLSQTLHVHMEAP